MMKQDPFYDKDAIREHGLTGLEDERRWTDLLRYAIMLEKAVYWLKKLEKSEREERDAERARERAALHEVFYGLGNRHRVYHKPMEGMKEGQVKDTNRQ